MVRRRLRSYINFNAKRKGENINETQNPGP